MTYRQPKTHHHHIRPGQFISVVFWVLMAVFCSIPASADTAAAIQLHAKVKVNDDTVLLGQIATIETQDPQLKAALESVQVGQAPLPGNSLYINPGQVELGLRKSNFEPKNFTLSAVGPVKVTRIHHTVSAKFIEDAIVAYIKGHAPWNADQLKIRPINYTQSHIVPSGRINLQIFPPKHTDWLGGVPFSVNILVAGQTVKKISVSTYIEVWQNVILAAKPLGRNQPITQSDIKTTSMNLTRVPANAILDPDQVIGRRANRSIAINSILRIDQVDLPPLIRRGDLVQVIAETKTVRVSTNAVARQDGKLGERIRLVNERSKKTLYGYVVDPQTVKVEF